MSNKDIQLTVGNDNVDTQDITKGEGIDVVDRDPTRMNDHVKLTFEEIFAEPHPTIFAFDNVWILSYKCFTNTNLWCYRITTLICAIPLSVIWGIYFACLEFCTIWYCVPCMKAYDIELHCVRKTWETILNTFVRPCYEACGYIFIT